MKRLSTFLMALLLTWIGASAQGYVTVITNTQATWMGATGGYSIGGNGVERYATAEYGTGKILYQSVAGLAAGTYKVTFYAAASYTSGRDFTAACGENIAQAFANETTEAVTVNDVGSNLVTLSENSHTLQCTVGADGVLEYGLQNIATGGNWYCCQGESITLIEAITPTVEVGELHTCVADIGHWTTTGNNGTFVLNDWSVENDESGMKVPFCQNWVWEGDNKDVVLTTAKISHAPFTGLPAGYYEVSLDIRILNELGTSIGTGTTFNVNNASEDLDKTDIDGHEGTYGDATEVYGTYTLIAEVTETDGTLDISIQLPESPTYNWIAWKNLKVEYLGTTIEYEIHEPECSAKVVQPGDEVSIVYECITPDTDETPTLDTAKSITVGTATVTLGEDALDCAGYSATVTFTIPDGITVGEDITISVPAGLIYWNLQEADVPAENVLSPEATFTVHTPATITDGDYLIMNSDGNYLAGGLTWGTQAMEGGKPQFFTFEAQTDGTYTLDSHQSNGGESHYLGAGLYCDAESAHWTLVAIDGGYALYYAEANSYVTGNGFQVAVTLSDEPTVWTLVTKDEIIASMASATEESPVDVSALIPACEPKRNPWGDSWTMTAYDGTSTINNGTLGQGANVASCAESYYSTNGFDFHQSVTFPKKGVYELSAQAFYSGTAGAVMYVSSSYSTGYNTDGNSVALPAQGGTSASNMVTAYQEFLEEQHPVSLQFTVDSEEATLYVGFSSAAESNSAWNIFGELGLRYLGVAEETVEWEMTTANWGTLILPFAVAADDVPEGLTVYTCDDTTSTTDDTTGETTTTVVVTEVEDGIAANTPYLVKGNVEQDTEYTFSGTSVEAEGALTQGLLIGTFEEMDYNALVVAAGSNTVYLLQNHTGEGEEGVAFYPVTSESTGATLTANHCYLTLSSSSPVRGFISFPNTDDEATGIVAVESDLIASDAIYDLSGRRVSKAVKGVYIQNGKKVLVK